MMSEQHLEDGSVLSDLFTLLQSGEGADVMLVVGEAELPAHSIILAARSPVLAAALRHDMQEARNRRIEIADVREEVLKELLLFLYSDRTPQLASVAPELLAAAEKYDLPLLKKRCERQMMQDLSVDNAAATVALAVQYSCPELSNAAVEFIVVHPSVMASAGWERVLRDSAEAAVKVCKRLAAAGLPSRPPPAPSPLKPATKDLSTAPQSFKSRIIPEELRHTLATRLIEDARDGRAREVWVLLTAGAPRDARDDSGNSALHLAAANGHDSTVKCLIDAGLDVNAVNSSNQTPLHRAAQRGDTDVIWMLVMASARVDAQDDKGQTPLHVAAQKREGQSFWNSGNQAARAAVGALLVAGARKDILDVTAKTPERVATDVTEYAFRHYHYF